MHNDMCFIELSCALVNCYIIISASNIVSHGNESHIGKITLEGRSYKDLSSTSIASFLGCGSPKNLYSLQMVLLLRAGQLEKVTCEGF